MERKQYDLNLESRDALTMLQAQSEGKGLRLRLSQIVNMVIIQADMKQAIFKDPGPGDREEGGQLTVFWSAVTLQALERLRERTGWGPSRILRAALIWWAARKHDERRF